MNSCACTPTRVPLPRRAGRGPRGELRPAGTTDVRVHADARRATLFLLCPEGWFGCTGKFTWPVPDRGLHRIAAMTLVVWGGEDRVVPAAYADEFTRLVPHATAAIVGDAGHLPQVERLNDTWRAVGGFLRCLDPAPALS